MYGSRKRPSPRAASVALTEEREVDLVQGWRGAFDSDEDRRACWAANRERLMASTNPCCRPAAWWHYEAGVPRDPHRPDDEQLYAIGALTDAEREAFESRCARQHRDLASLPPVGFRGPDPRSFLRAVEPGT